MMVISGLRGLHNLEILIPNLPHAKLYFVYFLPKIQKQNGRQNLHYSWLTMNINKIIGAREFSYVVPEGHIATTIKQWHLNLITIIIVAHQVLIGNSFKVDFGEYKYIYCPLKL